jgi:hypothetical protein
VFIGAVLLTSQPMAAETGILLLLMVCAVLPGNDHHARRESVVAAEAQHSPKSVGRQARSGKLPFHPSAKFAHEDPGVELQGP